MSKCNECGKELSEPAAIKSGDLRFCDNLCRVIFERKTTSKPVQPARAKPKLQKSTPIMILAFGISFGLFYVGGSKSMEALTGWLKHRKPSDAELNKIASSLNTRLPMMLDQETQATTSVAIDGRLRYLYKLVRWSADSLDKAKLLEYVKNQTTSMSCTTPDTRALIDRNVDLEYYYMDRNDRFIFSYTLTKAACEALK